MNIGMKTDCKLVSADLGSFTVDMSFDSFVMIHDDYSRSMEVSTRLYRMKIEDTEWQVESAPAMPLVETCWNSR